MRLNEAMRMRRLIDEAIIDSQELRPPLKLLSSSMSAEQWTVLRRASVAASSPIDNNNNNNNSASTTSDGNRRLVKVMRLNGYAVRGTQTIELTHVPLFGATAVSPLADLLQLLSLLVGEQLRGIRDTPRTRSALIQLRQRRTDDIEQHSSTDIISSVKTGVAALSASSPFIKYGQTLCLALPLSDQ